jgi:hypothetical protein
MIYLIIVIRKREVTRLAALLNANKEGKRYGGFLYPPFCLWLWASESEVHSICIYGLQRLTKSYSDGQNGSWDGRECLIAFRSD